MIPTIMKKAGSTAANVATKAPGMPPCEIPTYVARLTMIGPGVLSLTAIIYVSMSSLSQPYDITTSRISGIAA